VTAWTHATGSEGFETPGWRTNTHMSRSRQLGLLVLATLVAAYALFRFLLAP